MAEGEFHESANLAALWQLPVLFVLREQPLRHGHRVGPRARADRPGRSRRLLRHGRPGPSTAWTSSPCRRPPSARRRPGARRGRSVLPGAAHLPLPGALDVRPRPLPRQGRGRAVARARPDPAPDRRAHRAGRAGRGRGRLLGDGDRARRSRPPSRQRRRRPSSRSRTSPASSPASERGRDDDVGAATLGRGRGGRRHDLPGGPARGASRGPAARRPGVPDGRGRRSLRRLLRRQPRPARGVRRRSGSATRPLSESAFVGAGIGAALRGMRPIVEIMTVNFSLLALDQILNNAATLLHMSGGQLAVPLVIRMTTGGGPAARRAALAQPRGLVRPHPRPAGPRTRPRSRTRAACCGRPCRTPTRC